MINVTTATRTSETRLTMIACTQRAEVQGVTCWHDIKINFHVNLLIYSDFIGRTHGRMEIIRLRMILQLCHLTNPAQYRTVCKSDRKRTLGNVKFVTSTEWTTPLVSVLDSQLQFWIHGTIFYASTKLLKDLV